MEEKEIGEIENVPCEVKHVEWRIRNFFSVTKDRNYCPYISPTFSVADNFWHLRLWPNSSLIDLFFGTAMERKYSVEYYIGFKKSDGKVELLATGILKEDVLCGNHTVHLIKETDLLLRKEELVPCDVLTVTCTLKWITGKNNPAYALNQAQSCKLIKLDTLSENFKSLFINKYNCDATLHVMDKEYKAHKVVLMARSSVFAAMFLHEITEKQTGIVTIPDCEPESFEKFLEFLYCGKLEKLSSRDALHLYETSDKYDVQGLKTSCVEYLMENLTIENVCDILIFADKYNESNLLSAGQKFFNEYANEIMDTSEWDSLVENNYRLSKTIMKEMVLKLKVVH